MNPPGADYWEKLPAPIVEVLKITRGTASPGHSCADAGTLSLSIQLPPESTYKLEQFGVYFRIVEGIPPDEIFAPIPIMGQIKGGKAEFFFPWLDGHPRRQKPLDLKVETFFVTNGLDIGPPTIFAVKDSK